MEWHGLGFGSRRKTSLTLMNTSSMVAPIEYMLGNYMSTSTSTTTTSASLWNMLEEGDEEGIKGDGFTAKQPVARMCVSLFRGVCVCVAVWLYRFCVCVCGCVCVCLDWIKYEQLL